MTEIVPTETVTGEEIQEGVTDPSEQLLEDAFSLSPEEFGRMKAADRETLMFLLLRDQVARFRSLEFRLNEYEEKARAMATPEGMQKVMGAVMGGMGGKGLLGSLL